MSGVREKEERNGLEGLGSFEEKQLRNAPIGVDCDNGDDIGSILLARLDWGSIDGWTLLKKYWLDVLIGNNDKDTSFEIVCSAGRGDQLFLVHNVIYNLFTYKIAMVQASKDPAFQLLGERLLPWSLKAQTRDFVI